jgi:hypothetical protein
MGVEILPFDVLKNARCATPLELRAEAIGDDLLLARQRISRIATSVMEPER